MSEVNLKKRKEKCENCTKQVNFWICVTSCACGMWGKNLVSLSIVNVSIDPLLTVQQETE